MTDGQSPLAFHLGTPRAMLDAAAPVAPETALGCPTRGSLMVIFGDSDVGETVAEEAMNGMAWFPRVFDVPLIRLIAATPMDPSDPSAGLSFVVEQSALNAAGVVHGGVLGAALDLAAYLSVLPTIGPGEQAVTHAIAASYLRACGPGETLVAKGSLLRRTRRLAFTSASIVSGDRLIATGSVTKSITGPPDRPREVN